MKMIPVAGSPVGVFRSIRKALCWLGLPGARRYREVHPVIKERLITARRSGNDAEASRLSELAEFLKRKMLKGCRVCDVSISNGSRGFCRLHWRAAGLALLLCVSGCATRKDTEWPAIFRLPKPETRRTPARALPAVPPKALTWQYPEPMPVSNVEFHVLTAPTPTGPWALLAVVDAPPVIVATDEPKGFFTVQSYWRR